MSRHTRLVVISFLVIVFLGDCHSSVPESGSEAITLMTKYNQTGRHDDAIRVAQDWLKKHPDQEVSLTLGHASRFPAPVWYVLWGNNKSGYFALVNATTGKTIDGK